ncbi:MULTISPECIES: glycosyltransferase [Microbacterium]|nr:MULTISPECIES: glycosyltransferase [Microbacterium]MCK6068103.1 hypothetical protein [Microbacterium sp. EYE_512]
MTTLFVAISGGHLAQLHQLAPRVTKGESTWVTDATPQSRSLLAGRRVRHVPTRPPRDWVGVLRDSAIVDRAILDHGVTRVISTGSQVALSAYLAAKRRRVPFAYVESATRVTHLSTTGRLLDKAPGVRRFVQHPTAVTSPRWAYRLSVFDGFTVHREHERELRRVVVTMGGNGEYGFTRLAERLRDLLPSDADVLWQLGSTPQLDLPGRVVASIPSHELQRAMREADVVIGHAGTGTALAALSAGKLPLLVPRRVIHGEHVDAHQEDLARALQGRGLAVVREADAVSLSDLVEVSQYAVQSADSPSEVDLFEA